MYHLQNNDAAPPGSTTREFSIAIDSLPKHQFTDVEPFKAQISQLLTAAADGDHGEITLGIKAPGIPDINLVELPSLVEDEPNSSDSFKSLHRAIKSYHKRHQNLVYLAFFNASKDVTASHTYSLLQELDPTSDRTVGVLTKVDLISSQHYKTQLTQVLSGKLLPIRNGYARVNCTRPYQRYKTEWHPVLNKLATAISNSMRVTLPAMHNRMQDKLRELEERLVELGEPLKLSTEGKHQYVWNLAGDFCYQFGESLAGKYEGLATRKVQELCLGAIIRMFYHELYDQEDSFFVEPTFDMKADAVLELINNWNNSSVDGFISIDAFLYMVAPCIDALMGPVKDLIAKVHECMRALAERLLNRIFFQFPELNSRLVERVQSFIDDLKSQTQSIIIQVLEANKTYFFTSDREFLKIDVSKLQQINQIHRSQKLPTDSAEKQKQSKVSTPSSPEGRRSPQKPEREKTAEEILKENQEFLAEEIYLRVRKYYHSVKTNLKDTVPRLLGCFLIKPLERDLQTFVTENLSTELRDNEVDLLKESEENAHERDSIKSTLSNMRKFRRNLLRDPNLSRLIREDHLDKYHKQHLKNIEEDLGLKLDLLQSPSKLSKRKEDESMLADPDSLDMRMSNWISKQKVEDRQILRPNPFQLIKDNPSMLAQSAAPQVMRGRGRGDVQLTRSGKRARTQNRTQNKQEHNREQMKSSIVSKFVLIENYLHRGQKFSKLVLSREEWLKIIDAGTLADVPAQKLQASAHDGIPQELRFSIWMLITDVNTLRKQHAKDYYEQLIAKENKWEVQINKDIPRTYPSEPYFIKPEYEAKEKLFRILRAYANYDEELGYTQGMNGIVGMMLVVLADEQGQGAHSSSANLAKHKSLEKAVFWMLVHIMKEKGWRKLLVDGCPKLIDCCMQLDKMLEKRTPEVYQRMDAIGLNTDMCFNQYFVTLCLYNTPKPLAARVLDLFLFRGEDVLFELLVKAVSMFKKEILQMSQMEHLFNFLKTDLMNECFRKYERTLDKVLPGLDP